MQKTRSVWVVSEQLVVDPCCRALWEAAGLYCRIAPLERRSWGIYISTAICHLLRVAPEETATLELPVCSSLLVPERGEEDQVHLVSVLEDDKH